MLKLSLRKLGTDTPLSHPAVLLATWFGSGLIKPASGTWGSVASLPFVAIFCLWLDSFTGLLSFIFLSFVIGLWASQIYMNKSGQHDASEIVIDETCGLSISCIPYFILNIQNMQGQMSLLLLCFALFRLFDAAKPWPISWCDRHIGGAFGVMFDDVLAGIAAAVSCYAIVLFCPPVMTWLIS